MDEPFTDDVTVTTPSGAQQVLMVARREFRTNARSKSFVIGTLVTVVGIALGVAAYSILPAVFGDDEVTVGTLPEADGIVEALPGALGETELTITALSDRAAAEQALIDGDVDAVLASDAQVLVHETLDTGLVEPLQSAASTAALAADLDATAEQVAASSAVALAVEPLDPPDPAASQRRFMTLVGVLAVLGQVMGGAFMLAYAVVEEKSSRVIEVVVAKAHPRVLLAGKLIGLGGVSLVQLAALVLGGLTAVVISPDLSIPPGLLGASGMIFVWFMLAYAIFGALFSIAGSITARQEDMQQKLMPAMYGLFAVFAFAFVAFNSPDSTVTTVASFVPLTAPAVVPLLDAIVGLSAWHVVLSMLSTLIGAVAALWVSGAVYAGGALRLRGKTTMREALTSARGERARA